MTRAWRKLTYGSVLVASTAWADDPASAPCCPDILTPIAAPGGGLTAEVDFLVRWFKPVCLKAPVITTGNPQDAVPGAIGQRGTAIVVGGEPAHRFEFGATPGVALKLGWVRCDGAFGVELGGFAMDTATAGQGFVATADGSPATYLPYQAPDNRQLAFPFTVPGAVTGSSIATGSTQVWGVEGNAFVLFAVPRGPATLTGKFLVGVRYLDLTDRVRVENTLRQVNDPAAFASGAAEFTTENKFVGPQIGTTVGTTVGRWSLDATLKFAAGVTEQTRIIAGTPLAAATAPGLLPGPLLALPSNVGRASSWRGTLVPEVGVKSRFDLTEQWSLTLGYSLVYWNKVLCPGDQMDGVVNVTQLPGHGPVVGPLRPAAPFVHTDYFAQGFDLGVQFRY